MSEIFIYNCISTGAKLHHTVRSTKILLLLFVSSCQPVDNFGYTQNNQEKFFTRAFIVYTPMSFSLYEI